MGFPPRHCGRVPKSPKVWMDAATRIFRVLADGEGDGIVAIVGIRGTGKTQLAVAIALLGLGVRWQSALYRRAMDMFIALRATYDDAEKRESALIAQFVDTPLLIIDEMQERSQSEWEQRTLTHIIDRRYGSMRPTLMIGNFENAKAFASHVGASIASRCVETGGIMVPKWESFRVAKTQVQRRSGTEPDVQGEGVRQQGGDEVRGRTGSDEGDG